MNKEWSELNKDAKNLLNKKSSFKDGINKLIQLRTLLINEWKNVMKDLSIEDYSKQPFINKDGYESKTIAYSIYHVFRIEDIVLNTLIKNKEQVFLRDDYQNKMNLSIITTGNELMRENISQFSKTLIIEELWKYAKNVFEESNEWLSSIDYEDLKIVFSELDKERQNFLINSLSGVQVFITTTELSEEVEKSLGNIKYFDIESGSIISERENV